MAAGYHGGLYRRRIIANDQVSEGLTAQLWASSALAAFANWAPRGSEGAEELSNIKEALELAKAAYQSNFQNVVERMNGTVTPHHADQPYNDCNSFVKWSDAHSRMMAARRCRGGVF